MYPRARCSVDEGEAADLMERLKWAKNMSWERVVFEIDATRIWDAVHSHSHDIIDYSLGDLIDICVSRFCWMIIFSN